MESLVDKTKYTRVICNDKQEYLIAMLKSLQNGYELPDTVTEADWLYIRDHKDEDKALAGFVGHACSFGGRWFEGYARSKATKRNFARESKDTMLKKMQTLMDTKFICGDYRDVVIPEGAVVYADPPYANTKEYNGETFDSVQLWDYMRELSKDHIVFISEQQAPDDFICIWERMCTRTLDRNKNNQPKRPERLYIHRSQLVGQ